MARKTSKTRKTTKAASRKKTARRSSSAKKSASRKSARKKTPARKAKPKRAAAKKSVRSASKRKTVKKPTHKRKVAKKAVRRVARKPAKKSAKKVARQTARQTARQVAKPTSKKSGRTQSPASKPPHKGITIVAKKPVRRRRAPTVIPKLGRGLLEPGGKRPKPLIPSGPKNVPSASDPASRKAGGAQAKKKSKSPFNKRQLKKFRDVLLRKRAELVGDVSEMEREALLSGGSGGLSHTPSHMAEQGSDAYDQALSLNIAAVDRKLIKEIDDALARIEKGTYGLCVLSGGPISTERLEELPWAKHSIDSAREIERRSMRL